MAKRNSRNTRGRIISAAWKLFYEQGYDGTTVEDIVFESGTSKGSFYHYFDGKDALMGTLAYVFDEKYEDLMPTLDPEKGAIETLAYINHELYVQRVHRPADPSAVHPIAGPGRKAPAGPEPGLLPLAEKDRPSGCGAGRIPPRSGSGGDRPGLRHVGTGTALRLVPVRRGLLSGGLRGEDDAPVFGEFPSQRINLIFCFSSIPSFCTV